MYYLYTGYCTLICGTQSSFVLSMKIFQDSGFCYRPLVRLLIPLVLFFSSYMEFRHIASPKRNNGVIVSSFLSMKHTHSRCIVGNSVSCRNTRVKQTVLPRINSSSCLHTLLLFRKGVRSSWNMSGMVWTNGLFFRSSVLLQKNGAARYEVYVVGFRELRCQARNFRL